MLPPVAPGPCASPRSPAANAARATRTTETNRRISLLSSLLLSGPVLFGEPALPNERRSWKLTAFSRILQPLFLTRYDHATQRIPGCRDRIGGGRSRSGNGSDSEHWRPDR